MSEPDFNIDEAAAAFDANKETLPLPEVEELDEDGNVITQPEEIDDPLPPGFLTFEEYVERGGDPEMYRGRKAYESEHERIAENKRLRKEMQGMQATVNHTMEAVQEWRTTEREKVRKEVEAELRTAKENEDVDGAIAAQKQLDALDETPPAGAPVPENPVIVDFRTANPKIDKDADEFDAEYNADVEAFYNATYTQLSQGGRRQLTDGQIKRLLTKAVKEADDLHGIQETKPSGDGNGDGRGESPRNNRGAGAGRGRRAAAARDTVPKAENYVIENPRNARQTHAAPEVRDMIRNKALDQAKKTGKSDADAKKYADERVEQFERSLSQ